jgi:hypothetical protein
MNRHARRGARTGLMGLGIGLVLALAGCESHDECVPVMEQIEFTTPIEGEGTAEQLMAALGGQFMGTVEWRGGTKDVAVHPDVGTAALTLVLAYDGGEITLITHDTTALTSNERLACVDKLMIAAKLTITTDDGSLQGTWDVVANHELGAGAGFELDTVSFAADNLGDFSAMLIEPNGWKKDTETLAMTASFVDGDASGYILFGAEASDPQGVNLNLTLASWDLPRPSL